MLNNVLLLLAIAGTVAAAAAAAAFESVEMRGDKTSEAIIATTGDRMSNHVQYISEKKRKHENKRETTPEKKI